MKTIHITCAPTAIHKRTNVCIHIMHLSVWKSARSYLCRKVIHIFSIKYNQFLYSVYKQLLELAILITNINLSRIGKKKSIQLHWRVFVHYVLIHMTQFPLSFCSLKGWLLCLAHRIHAPIVWGITIFFLFFWQWFRF